MRICITGTPGTGKTTIARLLSKKLKWKVLELNKLTKENNLYCGYDRKRRVKVVDIEKLRQEVKGIKEKNLILESHYSHDMGCDIIIVLRVDPKELMKRGKKKGWPEEKIMENIEAEIMGVCREEAKETGKRFLEIDTTGKRPEYIADLIRKHIKA